MSHSRANHTARLRAAPLAQLLLLSVRAALLFPVDMVVYGVRVWTGSSRGLFTTYFGYSMRLMLNIVGVLCLLMGGTWFLQGVNILPGSFMTGQTKWAVYGGGLIVAGIGVLIGASRGRRRGQ